MLSQHHKLGGNLHMVIWWLGGVAALLGGYGCILECENIIM